MKKYHNHQVTMSQILIAESNLEQDKKRLAQNSLRAIAGTFLSRVVGVFRTLIINSFFGVNATLDSFNVAFRFPNSLRDLFADGALSAAFIKVLVDISSKDEASIPELINIIIGFFLTITLLIALAGAIFAKPFLILISGKQFVERGSLEQSIHLFQILVFYLPITMLNAVVMAVLGVKGDTFRAMNGSVFLNMGMIAGAVILAPLFSFFHASAIMGLGWGAILGAFLQLFYQALPLKKSNLIHWPCFNFSRWLHYSPLHTVLRLMAPRAFGQGAFIIALMINTFFAIQISPGAFTYVTTTVTIIQVPIGLFGVATGFAALPLLSTAFNNSNRILFNNLLEDSLSTTRWLSLFTLIGLAFLIVPLYFVLFQHGKVTFNDTIQNSVAICAYGIGIFFAANGKVLLNALYAVNATKQIIFNSIIYLIINASLTAFLTPRLGLIGLGLSFATATALDCWLNYFVVYRAIKRKFYKVKTHLPHFRTQVFSFFITSLASYIIGLVGVLLCLFFWQNFALITHISLTFYSSLIILVLGSLILFLIFLFSARWYGPHHLQLLLRKWF